MLLNHIHSREDLLRLSPQEDRQLCGEIREFLVRHVAKTGGHLASNLGVVELTVALHKVYDTAQDRLLFDVGHQSYVHKILTGRMDRFSTMRTYGGLAGFPKPGESEHDAFIAGHASESVSVALGMARARTLSGQNYHVAAVLGDGALTGGLAYEGLNDAGASGEPLVVVLNDNGMSITSNVGAISRHLKLLRLKPGYFGLKKVYRQLTRKLPGGETLYRCTHNLKAWLRRRLIGVTIFEEMGFTYLGPVDGHNVDRLTFLLKEARDMGGPVLLHVITKKGKGYIPAEVKPSKYHGVGRFDPLTGLSNGMSSMCFSETFGKALCEAAIEDKRICAITAAMEQGTGLSQFAASFKDRYFDVGIAEGHAVSMAAGLAKQGLLPVFAVYSTFLQRSFDMLQQDLGLLGLHVVLAVDRAGLVGEDGETHHGVFDVGYLRQVPGMEIYCPASQAELRRMLRLALWQSTGPVAVRYPRGGDGEYSQSQWIDQRIEGAQLTILTYGITINDVLAAVRRLSNDAVAADVIKLDRLLPLELDAVEASLAATGRILVVEEAAAAGSLGEAVAARLAQTGKMPRAMRLLNLQSGLVPHGATALLRHRVGLDADGIYQAAKELLAMKHKERLDVLLVEQGLAESRAKAQAIIMSGEVFVDGQKVDKPGASFDPSAVIDVRGHACPYVSRGGLKLEKALRDFGVDPTGYVCSDSGASTGGFTDCLLQQGARKVFAIDVGYGQLAWKIRNDPRVVTMERTNIRYVTPEQLGEPLDLSVIDVSFISLKLVLPAIRALLKPETGQVLCLIKPQFEAGKERVGKKGVVRDPAVHRDVLEEFMATAKSLSFTILNLTYSPVKGPEGNIEFLAHLTLAPGDDVQVDLTALVSQAHEALKG